MNDFENTRRSQLDEQLDAALQNYAAVEPRTGLEARILANLRAERAKVPERAWWGWAVLAALAVIAVAVTLAWRSGKPQHVVIAKHPSTSTPATVAIAKSSSRDDARSSHPLARRRKTPTHHAQLAVVAASNPKLDQFPSPQLLSEQEKLLQSYVAKYPEQAVLVARLRTEELKQDLREEMQASPSSAHDMNSEEQTNER